MSNYTKTTDFAAKDALSSGDPEKVATGTDVDVEFNAIATAVATKEDSANKNAANGYAGLGAGATLADARVAASNVTQHQAALTILESQITDSTVLARNAGTETISGVWNFTAQPTLDSLSIGFREIPQNSQTANYTLVAGDNGKHILHPSGGGAADTFTIPANASVAYPLGTVLTFANRDTNAVTIAITTDTMYFAGTGTTGSRTLAQNGVATAIKVESTVWIISGTGLS